jgi:long-chain fatty acid transport protein
MYEFRLFDISFMLFITVFCIVRGNVYISKINLIRNKSMKKQLLLITGLAGLAAMAFGGGIVTNTNQSAAWVRTMVRDASTDADAVYFNPAGLTRLDDGFHFSLNSQTIFQNKDVTDDYQFLNGSPKKYHGEVKAPVFPGFYAAWKKDKLAVSFGFNPIGGGGGAEFKTGLPSFETPISDLVPALSSSLAPLDAALGQAQPMGYGFNPNFSNITSYSADIYFKGTSVFFGYQLGVTYKISEMFGVFAGARYVSAKNTYTGYIHDVEIQAAPTAPPVPLYDVPAGSYKPGDYLRAVSGAAGLPQVAIDGLTQNAAMLDYATADVEVDAEETGHGITPILGLNITLNENLNIGLKYEFKTTIDLKQTVNDGKDGGGMFVQDSTVHSDMPAMLSAGIRYRFIPKMSVSGGFHYYFDKSANYGKTSDATGELVSNDKVIENNYYEMALGLEYNITDKFLVSGGYLYAKTGVTEDYQSDLSFSLTSNTFGFGFGYKFTDHLMVNLGGSYSSYQEGEKNYIHTMSLVGYEVPVKDTYYKDNLFFGIGIDFSF